MHLLITGTQMNYFFVCRRKLWLFSKNITMEHTSGLVEMGKTIHETAYQRKKKEILLDGIKIDFLEKNKGLIHEVKKSKSLEESHIRQLKYYLFYFESIGLFLEGMIDYPKLRRREKISLSDADREEIKFILKEIETLVQKKTPPEPIKKNFCRKCSYFELCYV